MLAVGGGGLSTSLETMQMVMWAMLSAPMIMSCVCARRAKRT
jgi:hypothetical protein